MVPHSAGCLLHLHVQPRARKTGIQGIHDQRLKVRLACPPVDGRANRELIRWLAVVLERPASAITLLRGERSRRKDVAVHGCSAQQARDRLRAVVGQ